MPLPKPVSRLDYFLAYIDGEKVELPRPITREEKYLAKIAGIPVELPAAPRTREEKYLAIWAGQDVEMPRPVTRIEKYLAQVLGEEQELPKTPISRYEQYLTEASAGGPVAAPIVLGIVLDGDGQTIPVFDGYKPRIMEISGDIAVTTIGTYTTVFSLKDTTKYTWEDGATAPRSVTWTYPGQYSIPYEIKITKEPEQAEGMGIGSAINYDGIEVTAYNSDGSIFKDEIYTTGIIPEKELEFPEKKVRGVIATFKIDNKIIWQVEVIPDTNLEYNGDPPEKPGYTFMGWLPELGPITENVDFQAQFQEN